MHLTKSIGMIVAAVIAMVAIPAQAETMSQEQMARELASLRQEVAQLKAQSDESWLTERRAEEVKSLISEVLADAETRASLLESGLTAGHKNKFFLASADGKYLLNIYGQLQARYIANFRDTPDSDATDAELAGFQMRRMKLMFGGHIADPKFGYKVTLANTRDEGDTYLEEMWISYKFDNGIGLKFGRMKAPFLREELTSSSRQLAVERSYVNEQFSAGFVEGLAAAYEADMWKVCVAITDGAGSGEEASGSAVAPNKDWNTSDADFAITARADVKLAGEWGQMKDFTAWDGEPMAAFLGAAVHYEEAETGAGGVVNNNDSFISWTIDGSLEYQRFNLYGAVVGMHWDDEAPNADYDVFGIVVQGGYQFPLEGQSVEPFIRYEEVFEDDDIVAPAVFTEDQGLLTVGCNWYLKKHAAKMTVDVVWAMDNLLTGEDGLGLEQDVNADQDDQVALRAQFQLLF